VAPPAAMSEAASSSHWGVLVASTACGHKGAQKRRRQVDAWMRCACIHACMQASAVQGGVGMLHTQADCGRTGGGCTAVVQAARSTGSFGARKSDGGGGVVKERPRLLPGSHAPRCPGMAPKRALMSGGSHDGHHSMYPLQTDMLGVRGLCLVIDAMIPDG